MSSSTASVTAWLDEAGQLELAIAIVHAKRRRRAMISQARAPASLIQPSSAHVIAEIDEQPGGLSLNSAVAALLIQLSSGGASAELAGIEESVAAISEMLEHATSHADTSQQAVSVQSLVTGLLHIIQSRLPAIGQHPAPDAHSKRVLLSVDRSSGRCQMGAQLQHADGGPMPVDPQCDAGLAAGWVLQTLSRHHAPIFLIMLEESSAALLIAHEKLAADAATGGSNLCAVSGAPRPDSGNQSSSGPPPHTAASTATCPENLSAEGIFRLLETMRAAVELIPDWARSLVDSASDAAGGTDSMVVPHGATGSFKALLESFSTRILSSYKLSCIFGPGESQVAEATKGLAMQLLVALQHMAA